MPEIKDMEIKMDSSQQATITMQISYNINFLQSEVFSRNTFIEQLTLVDIKLEGEEELLTLHSELVKPSLQTKTREHIKTFPRSLLFKDDLSFRGQQMLRVIGALKPFHPEECKTSSEIIYF